MIALEKYLAICYPFWNEENVTKLKVFLVCFILAVANIARYIIFFPLNLIKLNRVFTGCIYVTSHVIFFWCQIKIFAVLFKRRARTFQRRISEKMDKLICIAIHMLLIYIVLSSSSFIPCLYLCLWRSSVYESVCRAVVFYCIFYVLDSVIQSLQSGKTRKSGLIPMSRL